MSASVNGQRAAIDQKTGSADAESALNSPVLGCAVSCRGRSPATGWRQTCFEHHPYQFIGSWQYREKSYLYYDFMTRDFFNFLANRDSTQDYWLAPGSGSYVWRKGPFEYKARQAELRALEAISHQNLGQDWSAKQKYRAIYGTNFPN